MMMMSSGVRASRGQLTFIRKIAVLEPVKDGFHEMVETTYDLYRQRGGSMFRLRRTEEKTYAIEQP